MFIDSFLEKAMAPHSSTLAWRIPWTEELGFSADRLQSMGSLRVGPDWATSLSLFTFMHWRRKWQPTPVLLPGESQRQWAPVYRVAQSRIRLKRLSSSSSSLNLAEHRTIDAQGDSTSIYPKSCVNIEIHMQRRTSNQKRMFPLFPICCYAHPLASFRTISEPQNSQDHFCLP